MLTEEEYTKLNVIISKIPFTYTGQAVKLSKIRDDLYRLLMVDNGRVHTRMVRI